MSCIALVLPCTGRFVSESDINFHVMGRATLGDMVSTELSTDAAGSCGCFGVSGRW